MNDVGKACGNSVVSRMWKARALTLHHHSTCSFEKQPLSRLFGLKAEPTILSALWVRVALAYLISLGVDRTLQLQVLVDVEGSSGALTRTKSIMECTQSQGL